MDEIKLDDEHPHPPVFLFNRLNLNLPHNLLRWLNPHSPRPPPPPSPSHAPSQARASGPDRTRHPGAMDSKKVSDYVVNTVLGIDVNERYAHEPANLEEKARQVLGPEGEIFIEEEPSVAEFFKDLAPTRAGTVHYITSLFPSASWIRRYKGAWLLGDVVAGITIGLVVVPQAMAYALLARLTPAYGLYTSFTGAVLYWLFGTSKDIVIGTTAVGSLLVGQVVSKVDSKAPGQYTHEETAHALSMLSGAVLLFFGLLRLGWIIEFIPYIPISAFVTAASITIMSTQVPTALGLHDIDTHDPPYKVIINTLKSIPDIRLDAAIGLTSIVMLFIIRDFCAKMEVRHPHQKRMWSFISSLRLTFAMLLFTLISYLVNRNLKLEDSKFRIVGTIEPGFQRANLPSPDTKLLGIILPELPAIAIILVIEHIAIAKAMGRLYNYTITPSQEIVALGAANMFSPFVGGYVCTGSFGASAVLSKAGVRTPLAGLFSALVLVLALYVLTAVFYYIPNAALAGLIIHAVYNLIAPPKNLYKYWQLSPLELLIWVVGVVLAIFDTLETSIYAGIILSFVLMLVRVARTKGQFLGQVKVQRVSEKDEQGFSRQSSKTSLAKTKSEETELLRDVYVPLQATRAANPNIEVESPYPGVFVYRFSESYNYTNQAFHVDLLRSHIIEHTRRMSEEHFEKASDRLWNDPGPKNTKEEERELPYLRAVVLDFGAVNNLDITSVQGLADLRDIFNRHCAPDAVEVHFANVRNRWARRALAVAGFGFPSARNEQALSAWVPAYTIGGLRDIEEVNTLPSPTRTAADVEAAPTEPTPKGLFNADAVSAEAGKLHSHQRDQKMAPIYGVNRPFFHVDLHDAVDAAVRDARNKDRGNERIIATPP